MKEKSRTGRTIWVTIPVVHYRKIADLAKKRGVKLTSLMRDLITNFISGDKRDGN